MDNLRVAFIVGGLTQGGAEKQLLYMIRALRDEGVEVRVYCFTQGDFWEQRIRDLDVPVIWVGRRASRILRLASLERCLRAFRPHIVQSSHLFVNLYAAIAGKAVGAVTIGASRGDVIHDIKGSGVLGPLQLKLADLLVANSAAAKATAVSKGLREERIMVLSNVIDLEAFDTAGSVGSQTRLPGEMMIVACVGRLIAAKRVDRFLEALSIARKREPGITGIIVGDGGLRDVLGEEASRLGLEANELRFLGTRNDVPSILSEADILVLSSDHEGFPNAVIEAMAARLPVIMTPLGDAASMVEECGCGFVVPFDDVSLMAERILELARSPELRKRMGGLGRKHVTQYFGCASLAGRLLDIYKYVAECRRDKKLVNLLNNRPMGKEG